MFWNLIICSRSFTDGMPSSIWLTSSFHLLKIIVNFPFICNNIPAAPAYGIYISQIILYSIACGSYQDFFDRGLLQTRKLSFKIFRSLSWHAEYLCHREQWIYSAYCNHNLLLSSFMLWFIIGFLLGSNTTGATIITGTVPFQSIWIHPKFSVGSSCSIFTFL